MIQISNSGRNGMVVAPDSRAAQVGQQVLAEGGSAIEATVSATAVLAVIFPHMCGLGGDSFWLLASGKGKPPEVIDASGAAAASVSSGYYTRQGYSRIPERGPQAALTMAGMIGGIETALAYDTKTTPRLPLKRLLAPAIDYAQHGFQPGQHLQNTLAGRLESFKAYPGFSEHFELSDGQHRMSALAATLQQLADAGLSDFYQGDLADVMAKELESVGSPIRLRDFREHRSRLDTPLQLVHSLGTFYNTPAPTQGAASLMLLGVMDRLKAFPSMPDSEKIHYMVEATKVVFGIRDACITDPAHLPAGYHEMLTDANVAGIVTQLTERTKPPAGAGTVGDTAWVGAVDASGGAVSSIHSLFHDFGSATVLGRTGILWQNRGAAFGLNETDPNRLRGGCRPRHTLNPAIADFKDGRRVLYGVMGGDGQPQFQAAIMAQLLYRNASAEDAVAALRWLQGGTWGAARQSLKLEEGWPEEVIRDLQARGHEVEILPHYDARFGQAGVIVLHPNGETEASSDPRSDGGAAG